MPALAAACCAIGFGGVLMPEMSGWTIVSQSLVKPSFWPCVMFDVISPWICDAVVVIVPVGSPQKPQSRLKWSNVWLMKLNQDLLAWIAGVRLSGVYSPGVEPTPTNGKSTFIVGVFACRRLACSQATRLVMSVALLR